MAFLLTNRLGCSRESELAIAKGVIPRTFQLDERLVEDLILAEEIVGSDSSCPLVCRTILHDLLKLHMKDPDDVVANGTDCFKAYSEIPPLSLIDREPQRAAVSCS